ncbi:MAG: hypothetical protein NZ902_00765 [Acidilobaceae archaeon]|nr:hypothetical protein [Acidilobaceae archaeon]MCX8165362.1 hypothetical protein [Acidilobaceae archaeon]MDW7973788.1 hypothetical protein [Sulfolobales archaeon]
MRVPYLLSLGYEGEEERIAKNMKRYVIETTSYTLSTAISTNLVNALAMRYMGYGIVEIGALTLLRTAAVSVGSVAALPLLERYRRERLRVWLLFGTVNRVGWALTALAPLLPPPLNHATLLGVVASAQLAGAIAGVASMDTLADNVRPSVAGKFFGAVASLNNLATLLAFLLTLLAFRLLSPEWAYASLYSLALATALLSTWSLATLKDFFPKESRELDLKGAMRGYAEVLVKDVSSGRFIALSNAFTFAVHVPSAFWDYYVVRVMGGDETWLTVKNIANMALKSLSLKLWSSYLNIIGARRSVLASMFSTAPIPVLYTSSDSLMALVGVNVYASIAWTPWEIANTLYTMYLVPESKRPSFVSAQNVASNAVATIGTGFGVLVASISGVTSAFVISSLLRAAVALLSVRWMPELER